MFTLVDLSMIETDVLRKSVIDTFMMEAPLSELVPWETIGALATGIVRMQDLPSVGFRKINQGWDESTGHFEQTVETIALMGADIDTDKAIARAKNTIADARAIQQTMMMKAMAYSFNDKFINGDPVTDITEFKGISKRVDDMYTEGYTDQYIDVELDTSTEGILHDSDSRHRFLNKLDELIYSIKGHQPDFLLMNRKTLLAIRSLLRMEKLLDTTKDFFDRKVDTYSNCRMIDIGTKANQTTEIIGNTESLGEGSTETSIYAVKFGIGEFLWGIQEYPMEVEDLGELQEAPKFRTRVDWPLGLAMIDPRSIGRLYGIIPTTAA